MISNKSCRILYTPEWNMIANNLYIKYLSIYYVRYNPETIKMIANNSYIKNSIIFLPKYYHSGVNMNANNLYIKI